MPRNYKHTLFYRMVQKVFRYLELFRRDLRTWRTKRHAALNYWMRCADKNPVYVYMSFWGTFDAEMSTRL